MKYDVFISYSRKDFAEVYALRKRIEEDIPEIKIWFDIDGVESGDGFEDIIVQAIDNSSYVLFAISDNSIDSEWTKDEIMYARNTEKRVVPVLLSGAKLKGWFLLKFGRVDCIDYTNDLQYTKFIENIAEWCRLRTKNQYFVRFIADGVTIKEALLNIGDPITIPDAPIKEGYAFQSWGEIANVIPARNLEYKAVYVINKYSVTFCIDGVYDTKELEYGSPIMEPASPTKKGHTFLGWDKPIASCVPAHDLQYTAKFRPNKYKVRFIADNNIIKEDELDFGTHIDTPQPPTKPGHSFKSWGYVPETVPASNVVFTAEYVKRKYKVTYKIGEKEITTEHEFGSTLPKPNAPEMEGMTFVGWDKEVVSTMPACDLVYTAQFKPNIYKVTFIVDGKSTIREFEYGSKIIAPDVNVKEGYTYGWDKKIVQTMPAFDLTYTAVIRPKKYMVTFRIGGQNTIQHLEYGTRIIAPSATRYGYDFIGWEPELDESVPAHNVTYEAQYKENQKEKIESIIRDKKDEINRSIDKKKSDLKWWWKYDCKGFREKLIKSAAITSAALVFFFTALLPLIIETIWTLTSSDGTQILPGHSEEDGFFEIFYDGAFISQIHTDTFDFILYFLFFCVIWLIGPIGWCSIGIGYKLAKIVKKQIIKKSNYWEMDKEPSLYTLPILMSIFYGTIVAILLYLIM